MKGKKFQFKRRREKRTDYSARLALLLSELPRLVVRKTDRYIIAQIVRSKEARDTVVSTTNSKELLGYGWSTSTKNIPAAYLTGFLAGLKAKKAGIGKAILDVGLARTTKGSRIFAVLQGCLDAGLNIPHSKEMLPTKERLRGAHINKQLAEMQEKVKEEIKKKNA